MRKEVAATDPRLVEGRGILHASRERIAPLWVIFRDEDTTLKEKVRFGPFWKREIDEHIRAARGPISEAKLDPRLRRALRRLTQRRVERLAKQQMTDLVVFHGGTREDGIELGDRLVSLTKNIQRREGVSDNPPIVGRASRHNGIFDNNLARAKIA